MKDGDESPNTVSEPGSARLHYLDWLRLLATLMVFLFHAVHPFDFGDWQVKNVEQSEIITIMLELLGLWGMPFFFLVASAGRASTCGSDSAAWPSPLSWGPSCSRP